VESSTTTYELTLSSTVSSLFEKYPDIIYQDTLTFAAGASPLAIGAGITGAVYRHGNVQKMQISTVDFRSMFIDMEEWPPGRLSAFALSLYLQTTDSADTTPFLRTACEGNGKVTEWTRGDRERVIYTEYKERMLTFRDTKTKTSQVIYYPYSVTYADEKWTCQYSGLLITLLRMLWQHHAY